MNSIINILLFVVSILALLALIVAVQLNLERLNFDEFLSSKTNLIETKDEVTEQKNGWVSELVSSDFSSQIPSSELFISLDFSPANKTDVLIINNLDSYKFFCLNEILKSNNIQFAYKKTGEKIRLEVALNSQNTRAKLLGELKKYNISYSII